MATRRCPWCTLVSISMDRDRLYGNTEVSMVYLGQHLDGLGPSLWQHGGVHGVPWSAPRWIGTVSMATRRCPWCTLVRPSMDRDRLYGNTEVPMVYHGQPLSMDRDHLYGNMEMYLVSHSKDGDPGLNRVTMTSPP